MTIPKPKPSPLEAQPGGTAAPLVADLTPEERRQVWTASLALRRRLPGDPARERLSVECAFEAAAARLRAAKAGDEASAQAFERLVRDGGLAGQEDDEALHQVLAQLEASEEFRRDVDRFVADQARLLERLLG